MARGTIILLMLAEVRSRFSCSAGADSVADDGRLRFDPAPYTMVEGFLQLMQPLTKEDVG